MSSPQTATPNQGFQNRLNRVAEKRAPHEAAKQPVDVLPDWKENASGPAGIAFAILIGIAAVFLVRLGRYHVMGEALVTDSPDITLAIETGAALLLSFLLFAALPWKGFQYKLLQLGGVLLMLTTMHNMVHSSPWFFKLTFSPEWTERVVTETEASSIYLRGQSVPFTGKVTEDESEQAVAPAAATAEAPEAAPAAEAAPVAEPEPEKPALPRRIQIGQ